jgi:hypothetical protein
VQVSGGRKLISQADSASLVAFASDVPPTLQPMDSPLLSMGKSDIGVEIMLRFWEKLHLPPRGGPKPVVFFEGQGLGNNSRSKLPQVIPFFSRKRCDLELSRSTTPHRNRVKAVNLNRAEIRVVSTLNKRRGIIYIFA